MSEDKQHAENLGSSVGSTDLLPCPFCGGDPFRLGLTIVCRCGVTKHTTPNAGIRERVVAEWNRRDGDPCREGCKIKRAVKEMSDSLTADY